MPNFTEPFYLIIFEEKASNVLPVSLKSPPLRSSAVQRELEQLREELASTKLSLQHTFEEQDASNEELRAANEEILSSNEELQSTNEEMETATEELQSSNEELMTLNDELQSRNTELQELSDDLGNLFGSVDIPIIMLSDDRRIRRFNPRAVKVLNLISRDIGRPISDFKLKLKLPNLQELITEVLESLTVKEQEVQDMEGRWYALRIRPYKTADNRINGVVITLQDIDAVKHTLEEVEGARSLAEAIVATVRESLLILDADLRVRTANQSYYTCFRTGREETEGKLIHELGGGVWAGPALRELLEKVLPEQSTFQDFRMEISLPGVKKKMMLLNARQLISSAGHRPTILLAMEEVTGKPNPP